MQVIEAQQGSDVWKEIRTKYKTASEAPAMMGASKVRKRGDLLRMHATGGEQEFARFVEEVVFPRGHEVERQARPIAEEIIDDDLLRLTVVSDDGRRLSSMDGLTDDLEIGWECKQWNEEKAKQVRDLRVVPDEDYWQVVHQLSCGVKRVLYMVTDGTADRCEHVWVTAEEAQSDIDLLLRAWTQFDADLAVYTPEEIKVAPVAEVVEDLPAVAIVVDGEIAIKNNLDKFEEAFKVFVEDQLIKKPVTDQDFATLEAQIKTLKKAESALDAAESIMLSQMTAIDAVKKMKDTLRESARQHRLASEKLLAAEKENRRTQIMRAAAEDFQKHREQIEEGLGGKIILPNIDCNIAAAMKGKKTISGLEEAANVCVMKAKIEASRVGDLMRANLETLRHRSEGFEFLFRDAQDLVQKSAEDLLAVISTRIAEHKQAQEERDRQIAEQAAREERERLEREESERQAAEQAQLDQTSGEADQEAFGEGEPPARGGSQRLNDALDTISGLPPSEPVKLTSEETVVVDTKPRSSLDRAKTVAALREHGAPMSAAKAQKILKAVEAGEIPGLRLIS